MVSIPDSKDEQNVVEYGRDLLTRIGSMIPRLETRTIISEEGYEYTETFNIPRQLTRQPLPRRIDEILYTHIPQVVFT